MNITNDNHKGCSLEEFVDFNLDELLLDDIINSLKNFLLMVTYRVHYECLS